MTNNDNFIFFRCVILIGSFVLMVLILDFGPFSLVASKYQVPGTSSDYWVLGTLYILIHTTRVLLPVQYRNRRSEADPSSIKLSSTGAACCCCTCTVPCPMYRTVNLTNFTVLRSASKTKKAKTKDPKHKAQSTPIFH